MWCSFVCSNLLRNSVYTYKLELCFVFDNTERLEGGGGGEEEEEGRRRD